MLLTIAGILYWHGWIEERPKHSLLLVSYNDLYIYENELCTEMAGNISVCGEDYYYKSSTILSVCVCSPAPNLPSLGSHAKLDKGSCYMSHKHIPSPHQGLR